MNRSNLVAKFIAPIAATLFASAAFAHPSLVRQANAGSRNACFGCGKSVQAKSKSGGIVDLWKSCTSSR